MFELLLEHHFFKVKAADVHLLSVFLEVLRLLISIQMVLGAPTPQAYIKN